MYFGRGSVHYASPILQIHDLGPDQTLLAIERLETIAAAGEQLESPRNGG